MDGDTPQDENLQRLLQEPEAPPDTGQNQVEPGYLSLAQAAGSFPYSQEYISLLIRKGRLPGKKFGRNWYIRKEDLEQYVGDQAKKAISKAEELDPDVKDGGIRHVGKNLAEISKQLQENTQALREAQGEFTTHIKAVAQNLTLPPQVLPAQPIQSAITAQPKKPRLPLSIRQIFLTIVLVSVLSAPIYSNLFHVQDQVKQLKTQYSAITAQNPAPLTIDYASGELRTVIRAELDEAIKTLGLGQATVAPGTSSASDGESSGGTPAPTYSYSGVDLKISNNQIVAALRTVLSSGLPEDIKDGLRGEAGPAGPAGEPGPAGPAGADGGQLSYIPNSGSVFGTTAPTAPQGSQGTIGSATYLSAKEFITEKLTVNGETTQNGPVIFNSTLTVNGDTDLNGALDVSGNVGIGGTLGVTGATSLSTLSTSGLATLDSLSVVNNAAVGGTFSATGAATFGSTGSFADLLTASNGLTLTTGAINLTGTSGAINLSGLTGFSVNTGANDVIFTSNNFNVTSSGINATVIGATTPAVATFTTLNTTGNVGIGGTLGVTGAATLSSTLNAAGATSLGSTLVVTGATTLNSTLNVSGTSTITDLVASGQIRLTGNTADRLLIQPSSDPASPTKLVTIKNAAGAEQASLDSSGNLSLGGNATVAGVLNLTGNATIGGNTSITGTLAVTGNTSLSTLSTSGLATLNSLSVTNAGTFGGTLTSNGQLVATRAPSLAHLFAPSWPTGTSNVADSTLYVNPASSVADGNLIGAAVNGAVKFVVDAEGDIYGNNLILSGSSSSGNATITNLTVTDNSVFGDAPTDTVTFNAGISSHLIPTTDNTYDIGSAVKRWQDLYLSGSGTIDGNVGIGGNTSITGTLGVTGNTSLSTLSTSGLATLNSASITNNATVGGTLGVTGATTLSSTLNAAGATSLGSTLVVTGATTLNSTLNVSGTSTLADLVSSGQIKLTGNTADRLLIQPSSDPASPTKLVTIKNAAGAEQASLDSSGNLSLGGNATVAGVLNLTGNATIGGNTAITGTLAVTGNTSLSTLSTSGLATLNSLAVTNNAAVGGTFDATGAATFGSTGSFADLLTASNGLTLTTGALNLTSTSGAIALSGLTGFSVNTGVNDVIFTSNNFNVTSTGINATVIGATTPAAATFTTLNTTGNVGIGGNATVTGTFGVTGNTSLSTLSTSGLATLNSASITNNATVGGNLSVTGSITGNSATISSLTSGSVIFAGTAGAISQDNANFFWDDTNNRLGIGTISPAEKLDVVGNIRYTGEILLSDAANDDWAIGSDATATGLYFYNSTDGVYRMTLHDNGNVGIGTTSPGTLLQIGATTPTTAASGIQFGTDTSANLYRSAAATVRTDGSFIVGTNLTVNGGSTLLGNTTISGTLGVSGAVTFDNTFAVAGATQINSTLGATGAATFGSTGSFAGLLSANGGINTTTITASTSSNPANSVVLVQNSNSTPAGNLLQLQSGATPTDKFVVTHAGNTTIGGTLGVTGATSLSTLSTSGLATLNSASVTNNATVGGTLGVTGATTITGSLAANGGITVNTTNFTVSSSGNVGIGGTLNVTGATTAAGLTATGFTLNGNAALNGNVGLGDAAADTITFNGEVNSNVIPAADNLYDLGSASRQWANIYAGTLVATVTTIPGTTDNDFILNSDNATADTEDARMIFERGSVTPDAIIKWDGTDNRFEINQPVLLESSLEVNGATITGAVSVGSTLDVAGNFAINTNKFTVAAASGNVGIGGTLGVTGATTLSSTLGVSGLASFTGGVSANDLDISTSANPADSLLLISNTNATPTGNLLELQSGATPTDKFVVDVSGNVTAAGTLGVTGNTSLTTLSTSGLATLNSLSVTNNATVGGTLGVTGATTLSSTLTVNGQTNSRSIIPQSNLAYDLGAVGSYWNNTYINNLFANNATLGSVNLGKTTIVASTTDYALSVNQQGTGDILNLLDNGTEVLTVLDGGNVGIGIANPGAKLEIAGSSGVGGDQAAIYLHDTAGDTNSRTWAIQNSVGTAYGTLGFHVGSTANGTPSNTPSMVLLNNGKVGIGTANPAALLSVGATSQFQVSSAGLVSSSAFGVHDFGSSGTGEQIITTGNSAAGASNYGGYRIGNDVTGNLVTLLGMSSTNTLGGQYVASAGVLETQGSGGLSITAIHASGAVRFYTGGSTERMRIASSGNVGIGTTNPSAYKLEVVGGIVSTGGGNYLGIARRDTNALAWQMYSSAGELSFYSSGDKMTITSAGNVGIGTTNPQALLEVAGKISSNTAIGTGLASLTASATSNRLIAGSSSNDDMISLQMTATQGNIGQTYISTGSYKALSLRTSDTDRIYIQSGGNVGIGTTTPIGRLTFKQAANALSADGFVIEGNGTDASLRTYYNGSEFAFAATFSSTGGFKPIKFSTSDTERLRIATDGNIFINDSANANATIGLTINQGANDNEILALKSSDIAHGMTGRAEADNFASFAKRSATLGGLAIYGFSSGDATGLFLDGNVGAADPTDTTPAITLRGTKYNGTTSTAGLGDGETVLQLLNSSSQILTVLGSGNVGIGTTTVPEKLVVYGNSINLGLQAAASSQTLGLKWINQAGTDISSITSNTGVGDFTFNPYLASAAMTIKNTSGNVGIGDTTPAQLLTIKEQSAGSAAIEFQDTDDSRQGTLGIARTTDDLLIGTVNLDMVINNRFGTANGASLIFGVGDTERMRILGSGNVGIGTTNPQAKLDVTGGIRVNSAGTVTSGFADAVNMGTWDALGYNAAGTKVVLGGYRASQFAEVGLYTNGSERLTIDTSGNVGIGTTNPGARLSIQNSAATDSILTEYRTTAGTNAATFRTSDTGHIFGIHAQNSGDIYIKDTTDNVLFYGKNGGNVGIGTTNPAMKLDVRGSLQVYYDASTYFSTAQRNTGIVGLLGNGSDYFLNFDTANQKVLVGSDTTFGSKFGVGGNTSIGSTYAATAAPANGLIVEGNVGIGTTNPGSLLTVGANSTFKVNSDGDVTGSVATLNGSTTANGSGTTTTTLVLQAGAGANFDVGNYVKVDSTSCVTSVNTCYAKITAKSTDTLTISPALTWADLSPVTEVHVPEIGGTDTAQTLVNRYGRGYFVDGIVAGNGSTYFTDNLITTTTGNLNLMPSGNVGIGTTTPLARLSVNSSSESRVAMFRNSSAAWAAESNILLTTGDPDQGQGSLAWINRDEAATYPSQLQFRTIASNAEPTVKMSITGSGNVGIGTTTPAAALDVHATSPQIRVTSTGSSYSYLTQISGSGGAFVLHDNSGNDDVIIRSYGASYFNGGNVGIGTTNPGSLLSVGSTSQFKVNSDGDVLSGFTTLNGSTTANGAGTATTTLVLQAGAGANFDVGNYVKVDSIACVTGVNTCYAKITSKSTDTLTISPALTWATGSAVTEVHVPEIGGTDTAQTLVSRYGRGYFIDGIVAGNGSTYYTDNYVMPSGNFGIGTTNPGAALHIAKDNGLRIQDDGSVNYWQFETDSDGGLHITDDNTSELLTISNTGSLSIGTTSAGGKLDVKSSAVSTWPILARASDNSVLGGIFENADGSSAVYGYKADGTTIGFRFESNGASYFNGGNVGIGTTSASETLSIFGGTSYANIGQSDSAAYSGIAFGSSSAAVTTTNYSILGNGTNTYINRPAGGEIGFRENNVDQLTIEAGGNVGIGTNNPGAALETTISAASGDIAVFSISSGSDRLKVSADGTDSNILTAAGNNLKLGTSGSGIGMTILNSNGNVGIGTTTPLGKLHIADGFSGTTPYTGGGTPALVVEDSGLTTMQFLTGSDQESRIWFGDSAGVTDGLITYDHVSTAANDIMTFKVGGTADILTIKGTGNVGIGTTNPGTKLEVSGGSSLGRTKVTGAGTGYTQADILLQTSTSDTPESRGLGVYTFNEGTDANWYFGNPYASPDRFVINRKAGTSFDVATAETANSLFTMLSSGNVGIGTTSPQALLHLSSSATTNLDIDGAAASNGQIRFKSAGTTEAYVWHNNDLNFTGIGGGSETNSLFIQDTGKAGIGTLSPAAKLEVNYGATASAALRLVSASKYIDIGALNSTFAHFDTDTTAGFYFYDNITTPGSVNITGALSLDGGTNTLDNVTTGTYGTLQVNGSGAGSWEGYSIDGRAVFMHDGGTQTGLYNDVDDEWLIYAAHNGATDLYYNGLLKLQTASGGVNVTGAFNTTGLLTSPNINATTEFYTASGGNTRMNTNQFYCNNASDCHFNWSGTGITYVGNLTNGIRSGYLTQKAGHYVYPGSSSGTDYQTSYYLYSNSSWGLQTNTSFNATALYDAGNRVCSSSACSVSAATVTGTLTIGGQSIVDTSATYGSIALTSTSNGYYGINFGNSDSLPNLMWDTSGNGGTYDASEGLWINYFTDSTNHQNIMTSTDLGYTLGVSGTLGATGTITGSGTIIAGSEFYTSGGSSTRMNTNQFYCNNGSACHFNYGGTGNTYLGNGTGGSTITEINGRVDIPYFIRYTAGPVCNAHFTSGGWLECEPSDENLKNIDGEFEGGLAELRDITTIRFAFKDNPDNHTVGFSAQNVQSVLPEGATLVNGRQGEYLSLNQTAIVALAVNSIRELDDRTDMFVVDELGEVSLNQNLIPTSDANVGIGTDSNRFENVFTKSSSGYQFDIARNNGASQIQAGMLVAIEGEAEIRPRDSMPAALMRVAEPGDMAIYGVFMEKIENDEFIAGDLAANEYGSVATSGKIARLKVDNSGGSIAPGDFLQVSAAYPGFAAKADGTGTVVGMALASMNQMTGEIPVSLRLSYRLNLGQNASGNLTTLESDLDANGNSIFNVRAIMSLSGKWSIDEFGNLLALGHITVGKDTAGTATLPSGALTVDVVFEQAYAYPPKVTVTPLANVPGFWISNKTVNGFTINLVQAVTGDVEFDWHALAVEAPAEEPPPAAPSESTGGGSTEPPAEEQVTDPAPAEETPAEEPVIEEPAPEPAPEPVPAPAEEPAPEPAPTPAPAEVPAPEPATEPAPSE